MNLEVITEEQLKLRNFWINRISQLSSTFNSHIDRVGDFGTDAENIEIEIKEEIQQHGLESLLGHLRLCGSIPESYGHDTSEEKLYSKYTDIIINEAFISLGFNSSVIKRGGPIYLNNFFHFLSGSTAPVMLPPAKAAS